MDETTDSMNDVPIQPGCVVRLVSEERLMTIESVEGETAICVWHEDEELVRRSYLLTLLVHEG